MKDRRKSVSDIREIVVQLRSGRSNRQIAEALQMSRNTVKRYRAWAEAEGLLASELPELGELQSCLAETLGGSTPPPFNTQKL